MIYFKAGHRVPAGRVFAMNVPTKWLVANLWEFNFRSSRTIFQLVGNLDAREQDTMSAGSKEVILAVARRAAMAHGYNGLNFRDIAAEVGIRAPSIYHYFPTKADLGAAVARRYWEDIVTDLDAISDQSPDALSALHRYPEIFRLSLSNENRICLASFMAAEYDDLPEAVKTEVQRFGDVNVAWLSRLLSASGIVKPDDVPARARAIYSAVAGAQLFARGRSDISLFDAMVESYRAAGLLPV